MGVSSSLSKLFLEILRRLIKMRSQSSKNKLLVEIHCGKCYQLLYARHYKQNQKIFTYKIRLDNCPFCEEKKNDP